MNSQSATDPRSAAVAGSAPAAGPGRPRRVRVKVCGITRTADALAAAELGVDAIGLVFYPRSSRLVDAATAAAISRALPPFVTAVGLFLDAPADDVRDVLEQVPLELLQFHGEESPDYCRAFGKPYIKAVPMRLEADVSVADYASAFNDARGLLLDSHGGGVIGGSGETFDWTRIPPTLSRPLILAGGLDPDNVADAIRTVRPRPYALDVSSGVEAARGVKDPTLIARFMAAIADADSADVDSA